MQRRNRLLAALLLVLLPLLSGCGRRPVYSHFQAVDTQGWERTDTLRFRCQAAEAGLYHLRLDLRTQGGRYPYTRLALVARQHSLRRGTLSTDTLTLHVTDDEGTPLGTGLGMTLLSAELTPVVLDSAERLTVSVTHAMSRRQLPGIADVGVTLWQPEAAPR